MKIFQILKIDFPIDDASTQYFILASLILGLYIVGRIVRLLLRRGIKNKFALENLVYGSFLRAVSNSITFMLISLGAFMGLKIVEIPDIWTIAFDTSSSVLMVIAIGLFLYHLAEVPSVWFESLIEKSEKKLNKMFLPVIRKSLRVMIIILSLIQIIQIFSDKPITSIIAGLGIGGLAVAFAAQDTLRHFIGSFVVAGDTPFEIGDRVVVDGFDGPVESIGLRSTRIRSLEGHLVTIPNGELANRTIQNIGKRPYIRRLANITLTYDTLPEKITLALKIIKDILKDHEGMDPDFPPRVYFNELNADSLNILMIYWYHPPNYWDYMDFTQKVNLEILTRLNAEDIEFAFPTQTVHLVEQQS